MGRESIKGLVQSFVIVEVKPVMDCFPCPTWILVVLIINRFVYPFHLGIPVGRVFGNEVVGYPVSDQPGVQIASEFRAIGSLYGGNGESKILFCSL